MQQELCAETPIAGCAVCEYIHCPDPDVPDKGWSFTGWEEIKRSRAVRGESLSAVEGTEFVALKMRLNDDLRKVARFAACLDGSAPSQQIYRESLLALALSDM